MTYALVYLAIGIAYVIWGVACDRAKGNNNFTGGCGCVAIIISILIWPIPFTVDVVNIAAALLSPTIKQFTEKAKAAKEEQNQ